MHKAEKFLSSLGGIVDRDPPFGPKLLQIVGDTPNGLARAAFIKDLADRRIALRLRHDQTVKSRRFIR